MYNIERKQQFIQEVCTTNASSAFASAMFTSTDKYESMFGKDLCELSVKELEDVVPNIVSSNANHKIDTIIMIKKYTTWCKQNKYPVNKNILDVKPEQFKNYKACAKMFYNPEHLKLALDRLFPIEKNPTVNNIKRAYWWLTFLGVDKKDSLVLTKEEIDFDRLEIRPKGNKNVCYDICKEAVKDLKVACETVSFLHIHTEPYYEIYKQRIEGDKILRSLSPVIREAVFKAKTELSVNELDYQLNYKSVRMSGDFYRLYMRELAGMKPDFGSLIARDIYNTGKEHTPAQERVMINSLKYSYRVNYEQWKNNMIRK